MVHLFTAFAGTFVAMLLAGDRKAAPHPRQPFAAREGAADGDGEAPPPADLWDRLSTSFARRAS